MKTRECFIFLLSKLPVSVSSWMMCKGNFGLTDIMHILKQKTKCLNEKLFLKLDCNFFLKRGRMFINDVFRYDFKVNVSV